MADYVKAERNKAKEMPDKAGAATANPAAKTVPTAKTVVKTTIDKAEVEWFARMATEWWNPQGKFRPLHKFNPVRLTYIRDKICAAFDRNSAAAKPLQGLRILDIGCGGGLLCEPLARLGAEIIGIDAAAANIKIAEIHAKESGLQIDYRSETAEKLAATGEKFDVVLNMEVVEHVSNVPLFMESAALLVKPKGLMFIATLNRTFKAWGLAIIGAEYVLHWLPKGTHNWHKFLRPDELKTLLTKNGLTLINETGIVYNLLADKWELSRDMAVNYMLLARRLS